jgi:hypothetical protein
VTRATLLFAALLFAAPAARADATPPKGADPGKGDWCWSFFLAEREKAKQSAPPALHAPAAVERWARVAPLPGASVEVPPDFARGAAASGAWYAAHKKVDDPLRELASGFYPILVAWRDPAHTLDRLLEDLKDSGDLFPGTVTHQRRSTTFAGRRATELCAVVARSPGHATLTDGRHVPMPLTYDLVHAYEIDLGGQPARFAVRVEQGNLGDDAATFARMLLATTIAK